MAAEDTVSGLNSDRLLKAIKYRRSVRRFKQKPVSSGDLDMLLQAGRYTATAKNMQDCRFIFVQKELEILKTLKMCIRDSIRDRT